MGFDIQNNEEYANISGVLEYGSIAILGYLSYVTKQQIMTYEIGLFQWTKFNANYDSKATKYVH